MAHFSIITEGRSRVPNAWTYRYTHPYFRIIHMLWSSILIRSPYRHIDGNTKYNSPLINQSAYLLVLQNVLSFVRRMHATRLGETVFNHYIKSTISLKRVYR
jgi:hypothetical protein